MSHTTSPSRFTPRQRGLTLVELLLSLAITGVIGAVVATLLFAVTRGTDARNDMRESLVRQQILDHRLQAALGASKAVLALGDNFIVLWHADARADGKPNLSELRRIERDTTGRIVAYRGVLPANLTPEQQAAADTAYATDADFASITAGLKGNGLFPSETWASGVSGMTLTMDRGDTALSRLLSYRFTVQTAAGNDVFVGAVALRNNEQTSGSGAAGGAGQ